jgi:hypothetical protein
VPPAHTWKQEQIQFPKRCVLKLLDGAKIHALNNLVATHHRQNTAGSKDGD